MSLTQINLNGILTNIGDWVQLFGYKFSLQEVSNLAGTKDYEFLTGIVSGVDRVYSHD